MSKLKTLKSPRTSESERGNGHRDAETRLPLSSISAEEEGTEEEQALKEVFAKFGDVFEVGTDTFSTGQKLGVLQRLVTSVIQDNEYRQVLLTAAFDNKQEALLCADAIAECRRYGVPIEPLLDRIIAQCSVKGNRVQTVLGALTHYTLNTNYGGKLPDWKRRQNNKSLGGM